MSRIALWTIFWLAIANCLADFSGLYCWQPYIHPRSSAKLMMAWKDFKDADVLLLGSSLVAQGLDPTAIEQRLQEEGIKAKIFNAGVAAGTIFVNAAFLKAILKYSNPRVILLGVSPAEFNTENLRALKRYLLHFCPPSDLPQVLIGGVSHPEIIWSVIRAVFRPPGLPLQWFLRGESSYYSDLRLLREWKGQLKERKRDPPSTDPVRRALRFRKKALKPYEIGKLSEIAFCKILEMTKRRGIKLIVARMPVDERIVSVLYQQNEDKTFWNWLKKLCLVHGVSLVDLNQPPFPKFGGDDFWDGRHMRPSAAKQLSRKVAATILVPHLSPTRESYKD